MGNESLGCCRVAGEHRSQSWRVHETHAGRKQRAGHKDLQSGDMLRVLRVLLFRDILIDGLNRNICPPAAFKAHASGRMGAVADDRRHSSNWHDPSGQYAVTHQRIQDSGFAALELTDTGNIETSLGYPFRHGPRIGSNLLGVKLLSQVG